MDAATLRSKSRSNLQKELDDARARLKELQFKRSSNQLKDVRSVRETRKLIARLHTILREPQS
jgi:ribosomal protein L29